MAKLRTLEGGNLAFRCPGCKDMHVIPIGDGPGPRWNWNGDLDAPVLTPSILAKSGHYCDRHTPGDCWCTANAEEIAAGREPYDFSCGVCHSYVGCNGAAPGQIHFLADSTHALAGQTVDLPPVPE